MGAKIEERLNGFMSHKGITQGEGKILSDIGNTYDVVQDIIFGG